MTITQDNRHDMHSVLIDKLGRESATTLMELLPPVGWADVATKTDLQHLRDELKGDIKNLRDELKGDMHALQLTIEATLEKRLHEQTRWLITTMIAMNTVMLAASVALSKLI